MRKALIFVAVANFAYFFVEFIAAWKGNSVALFADSIDFLEDASVNVLILLALNWAPAARSKLGRGLALLILVPGLAALRTALDQFMNPVLPSPDAMTWVGFGALVVNFTCAMILVRYRKHAGSLGRAAFLSARNDVAANVAIIAAGFATVHWQSFWPDLIVGAGIAILNADAAREVWEAAASEAKEAQP